MHVLIKCDQAHYAHNVSHQKTDNFLLHTHREYEIYYFVCGDADYLIDGKEYHLKPHTLLLIAPEVFHGIRVHTNAMYDRHTLHFDPNLLSVEWRVPLLSIFPRAFPQGEHATLCCLENMEHSGVLPILRALEAGAGQDEHTHKILLTVLTQAVLSILMLCAPQASSATQETGRMSRTQREILEYLDAHFAESITLDALSERFFISKHYLNRVFRRATGTTVMDYLIHKRVSYVQQLLVNGIPAAQAAALAGFGDYTSFYRAYVKRFGHAPSHDRAGQERAKTPDIFRIRGVLRDQERHGALDSPENSTEYDGTVDENVRFWQQHTPPTRSVKPPQEESEPTEE